MALFPSSVKNTEEALNYLATLAQDTVTVVVTALTALTATAAQLIEGLFSTAGGTTCALTTPTGAQIVAAMANPQVGSSFTFNIVNTNSGTTTLTAGASGITLVGLATVATNTSATFRAVVTNITSGSEAVTIYCV